MVNRKKAALSLALMAAVALTGSLSVYASEANAQGNTCLLYTSYLLLVGSDAVYVGQTGLDTIQKRIQNTHSGDIDSLWHTCLLYTSGSP